MHQKFRHQLNIHTLSRSYKTRETMHPFNPLFFMKKKHALKKKIELT
jgi:hypothetical protein